MDTIPSVAFSKLVAIRNPKLYIIQVASYVCIVGMAVCLVVARPVYKEQVVPQLRQNIWTTIPQEWGVQSGSFCQNVATEYDYWPGNTWRYENTQCAEVATGLCTSADKSACVYKEDVTHSAADEAFFATAYINELEMADGTTSKMSYVIPGMENMKFNMLTEYQIKTPESYFHELFGIAHLANAGLLSVIHRPDGSVYKRFDNDGVLSLSVAEALDAAGKTLDDVIETASAEFPDSLDATKASRPKSRVVGMDIILNMDCSNAHMSADDYDYDGPVCKIEVEAVPAWMPRKLVNVIDDQGSVYSRTYSGVRITVKTTAMFSWFQLYKVVYGATLLLVWFRIPYYVVFYFAVLCLGALSEIYQGFLYEDVNLHREFNGVSARLLKSTYGFIDCHDISEGGSQGISLDQMSKRLEYILEKSEDLDKGERDMLTKFFFSECCSELPKSKTKCLQQQDFVKPFTDDENLQFEDIISIIDSDTSRRNVLEKFFMDESLKAFNKEADKLMEMPLDDLTKKEAVMKGHLDSEDALKEKINETRDLYVASQHGNLVKIKAAQAVIGERMNMIEEMLCGIKEQSDNVCGLFDIKS